MPTIEIICVLSTHTSGFLGLFFDKKILPLFKLVLLYVLVLFLYPILSFSCDFLELLINMCKDCSFVLVCSKRFLITIFSASILSILLLFVPIGFFPLLSSTKSNSFLSIIFHGFFF